MKMLFCPRHSWLEPMLIVGSAPFLAGQGSAPIPLNLSHLRTEANAVQRLAEEPNLPRRIIRVSDRKSNTLA